MKKRLKKEYEKEQQFNNQLDALKKEACVSEPRSGFEKHKTRNIILIASAACFTPVLVFGIVLACAFFPHIEIHSYETYKKVYSRDEIQLIQQNTFRPLNTVSYPEERENDSNGTAYCDAVNEFSSLVYQNLGKENQDLVFSPYSLYMNLDILSEFSADEEVSSLFDSVLGLTKETRKTETQKAFRRNFYENDRGYTKMHNGLFVTNRHPYRQEVIDDLTTRYTEAYSMNMNSDTDMNHMVDWVNANVGSEALTLEDLKKDNVITPDDEQLFYLFTMLSFKNTWGHPYQEQNSETDVFYSSSGEQNVTFMSHSYRGEYYDYGDYVSVTDYYYNGYSIQYIVPKEVSDNLFDLIKDKNIFVEDETTRKEVIVNLSMPKFSKKDSTNLLPVLPKIGLTDLADRNKDTLSGLFEEGSLEGNATLNLCKQLNQIEFTEDGTKATTIQITGGMECGTAAPSENDTIDVKLNQPFAYIIKDSSNLPLYVGQVNTI